MPAENYNFNRLAGKHVVILGATSGLGFAVAKACLAASASLTISSSSAERIESTIRKLLAEFPSGKVAGYPCNLAGDSVEQEIEQLFKNVESSGNHVVDHIVYTAADSLAITPIQEITREKIIAAGQMRFVAPILVAKIGSRYISPGPGSSITLSSGSVWERPIPDWTIIAGYMGAVCSATRNLALDLKPIRVNAVSPGLVDTEMWDSLVSADETKAMFHDQVTKLATGRVAAPEDVAEAYVYLMKDVNITGRIISTDSGQLLM